MSPKPIFATDVDGVLLNIWKPYFEYIKKQYGTKFGVGDINCWNHFEQFGFDSKESEQLWKLIWNTPAIPFPGAKKFIRELQRMGFEVVGVSNRPKGWHTCRQAAHRDFPQLGMDRYLLVDNDPKSKTLNQLPASYFIEDKPSNAIEAGVNSKAKVFLFDRPWNRPFHNLTGYVVPVESYDEILEVVAYDRQEER